jgi:predicted nucleic-acid-binding Zn-ribbon protein
MEMTNREVGYVCNDCDYSFFYTEDQDERLDGFTSLMGDEWFCPNCKEQNVSDSDMVIKAEE